MMSMEKENLTKHIVITESCIEGESGVSEADINKEKVLVIQSCTQGESGVSEADKNKLENVLTTESCIEGESGVSEADKNKEEYVLTTESCIEGESGVSEADKDKEEKVLIAESCTGDESGSCELNLNQEPREGMLFESAEAAKAFYDEYARRVGFLTRIISSRKSEDGSIIHRRLACNKEGFNQNRQKSTRVRIRKRESKREGCMARMNVKREKPGRYVISKFVKEHNHPLLITSGKDQSYHDDKDKKIQELSSELDHADQELVACRELLCAFMTSIEEHTNRLSKTVESAVQNIREIARDSYTVQSPRFVMASSSSQGLNLSRNYRQWLAETFDGHETLDDELSDSNLDGNSNLINPLVQNFPMNLEPGEPYIGLEFESAEDAREFYEIYGRHMGFTIRNNRTRRSLKDNSIIGREFVCSKEGFRAEKHTKRENRVFPSRPPTREGCNAMLRIAAKDGGKWVIYGFVKEHNHELNPSKIPPRRSHRIAFCEDEKDLKIRELSTELHREKKKSAVYQEQLQMVINYIEEHTQRLSLKVDAVSNNLRELESEDKDGPFSH
ncbi:hypothetical protein REPUB_Repub20aG0032400 [Reevesia pubescens]